MSESVIIWKRNQNGELASVTVRKSIWFSGSKSILDNETQEASIVVCPIHFRQSRAGYIGAALIPDELDGCAALNGAPLRAGVHALRHADRLDTQGQSLWFAADLAIEAVPYDPAVHGENQYCFVTKAPLTPQQDIVVCKGTPNHPCGQIYARPSWDRAMEASSKMRCANCGFHPDEAAWRPPEPSSSRTIDEIIKQITQTA